MLVTRKVHIWTLVLQESLNNLSAAYVAGLLSHPYNNNAPRRAPAYGLGLKP